MPDQPRWSERTLDMPPQDPWADPPTVPQPPPSAAAPGRPTAHIPAAQTAPAQTPPSLGQPAQAQPNQGQAAAPPGQFPVHAEAQPFSRGRAQVNPNPKTRQFADHEATGTGWPGAEAPHERHSLGWHVQQLRRGSEWSTAALLWAFVCWGIWAISSDGTLTVPIIIFVLCVVVAAGLFALSRFVGRLVLERQFGRVRRTAKGSHLVAALFLVGVGFAHLQQTAWVMRSYHFVVGLFS
ncbi:DNA-directed RNA polymerase II [Krasilnikovia sp. MM14-A1004]|uniref:DNA-directed RNA polymerase II n=1 Tax=Krasilnikovia sp. MM14-A1004 TaxID=3373541 RepID=UPI00399D10FD